MTMAVLHSRQGDPMQAIHEARGLDDYDPVEFEPTDRDPGPLAVRRRTYRHLTVIAGDGPLVAPELACHCTGLVHRHEPPFCPERPTGAAA